jgi:hypothetical protein
MEFWFQARGKVLEIGRRSSVLMMRREAAQTMAVNHGQPFLDEEPPRDSPGFNEVLTERFDAASEIIADWITDVELPLDLDLPSFKDTHDEELRRPLDERIGRNLGEDILMRVREPITHK